MQTITNLLNISRSLRFAPAPQRAQLMAQVIQGFNVDVSLLDKALSMMVSPQDPVVQQQQSQQQLIAQTIAKELQPFREIMSNVQSTRQQEQQKSERAMQEEISAFANDPKNEYFELVKDGMADILELAAKRGQKISLSDAYHRAILANNDLADQYSQSRLTQAATQVNNPAAQALKRANLSVTGAPSGESASAIGDSVRSALESAIAQHSGRG